MYKQEKENETSTLNIYLGSYLTRALKSSLRFSCSTPNSFNSLLVVSKADSAWSLALLDNSTCR